MDFKYNISKLEAEGRLIRAQSEADSVHELAGICKNLSGKAVLLEKTKGYK